MSADPFPLTDPPPRRRRPLVRRLWTGNPFYVLSAVLFLYGLRESFAARDSEAVDTWALMAGLAGYTLLLAAAALFLVRLARVWDDVRTVLLLVVLMFLATSVTFDELLALAPARGAWFYLGGYALAVAVTETLLRGLRLALPARFRVPYHLVLGLFFGYPVAITPFLDDPHGEPMLWALWGFAPAAGLLYLTLLPAARGGPVAGPWPWPYYPWSVFVVLGVAVVGRAFLLCWSFHLFDGSWGQIVFGPYFLVPFGFAVAVLLLELGLTAKHRPTLWAAAAAPLGLVAVAGVGHRDDPIYAEFLGHFVNRLWAAPLYLTVAAAAGYYGYALLRRAPLAAEGLTLALAGLAVVPPESLTFTAPTEPEPAAVLALGVLQLAIGFGRGNAGRCLLGTAAVAYGAAAALPAGTAWAVRAAAAGHVGLLGLSLIGAAFPGRVGAVFRAAATAAALFAGLGAVVARPSVPAAMPGWAVAAYPLVAVVLLLGYARLLRYRPAVLAAGVGLAGWLGAAGVRGYADLRLRVPGLDYLAVGLVLFPLAVAVSLAKGGALARWVAARRAGKGVELPTRVHYD